MTIILHEFTLIAYAYLSNIYNLIEDKDIEMRDYIVNIINKQNKKREIKFNKRFKKSLERSSKEKSYSELEVFDDPYNEIKNITKREKNYISKILEEQLQYFGLKNQWRIKL